MSHDVCAVWRCRVVCVRTQFDSLGFAGSWLPALRVLFEFDCRIRTQAIHTQR
jgi:hypothetical protein